MNELSQLLQKDYNKSPKLDIFYDDVPNFGNLLFLK